MVRISVIFCLSREVCGYWKTFGLRALRLSNAVMLESRLDTRSVDGARSLADILFKFVCIAARLRYDASAFQRRCRLCCLTQLEEI